MSKTVKLNRGLDIKLVGKAEKRIAESPQPDTFAIRTADFIGLKRSKSLVNEGDIVKAGTPLFYDKKNEKIKFPSPVSGEVVEVLRGEKRKLLQIKILADKKIEYLEFPKYSASQIESLSRESVLDALTTSGVWINFIQRPFAIVANPNDTPKHIFISAFDSSPLAPDYSFIFQGEESYFLTGLNVLKKLTPGKVHLNIKGDAESSSAVEKATGIQVNKFYGPHPAGNVGIQIHHISPINKGDTVWTLTPYGVIQIGKLFAEGRYDASKIVALAGSEVKSPAYYRTYTGANIKNIVANNIKGTNVRYISGNVLTGEKIAADGYLGFYHNMITVIPEGNYSEFLGWITPDPKKYSFHKAFGLFSFLSPNKEYVLDTNLHGEERPFVQTGAMEKVLPMDIYPVLLLKAILANDYDGMEALGIYEVAEEDFALCEFIDVSKNDIQAMIREGINMIQQS
ncbi:Na(+)-translocating NADH-quinone reductase subunit A [Rhodocytophaga rosea]|uniref:Na(+)-translocating NADH-quinone reductase subunit A n=1 Tax=Rhodocytophaga rosea TaxID=2704465 RepID=A0A6C0GPS8_9BACT|nr:Na(+)-translocating NADH-quinone reductase subunit A [Rhodocytophaga rosea]QHT70075.1 Na(+)-translocating NADH-quinone reductase subunit A [Rhodocytophaga rosea]